MDKQNLYFPIYLNKLSWLKCFQNYNISEVTFVFLKKLWKIETQFTESHFEFKDKSQEEEMDGSKRDEQFKKRILE